MDTTDQHDAMQGLEFGESGSDFQSRAVSPLREMGAYESLWAKPGTTFKSLSTIFGQHPGSLPSHFVEETEARNCARDVKQHFEDADIGKFGVEVHGAGEYPSRLRDAAHPVELLYYQGFWSLVDSPTVAVVGTRKPSAEGIERTKRLVRDLVKDGFTIVSGLAAGIDRVAHETAIEEGGHTIAVIGTPLSHAYPMENKELQRCIAENHLLISQVPLKRFDSQDYRRNRYFFPERNVTMSALSQATIIVEAGETSGTLIQARAAIRQHRKLFILDGCFQNSRLTWPTRFEEKGGIRVREYDDIKQHLSRSIHED